MQPYILTLHILAATIWTGGHLILSIAILPNVLKNKNVKALLEFENSYEKIGIPALIIQVLSGFYLVYALEPKISNWFSFADFTTNRIGFKLLLLLLTIGFALSARFFVIPKLSEKNLKLMAFHIVSVTIIGIIFVVVGVSFKNNIF